ncbi:EF-hand calcium-binding domain-containing protein 1 [Echinococcus granulosus]|nr:EF-hand calcium-binding domain-containing protein 1 [Echinococcus granulosus]
MSKVTLRKRISKASESLAKSTKFSRSECEALLNMYVDIASMTKNKTINRSIFRHTLFTIFNLTDDFILDRIFAVFYENSDGVISMEEWVKGLSILLRGDLKEKALFTFSVYDLNDDGVISRDEIFQMLSLSLANQADNEDNDEITRDLVEYAFKLLDVDHDGKITFDGYLKAVQGEILLLELLGPCLPTDLAATAFLVKFEDPHSKRRVKT